jgi:uncharacterized protein (TIGR03790 family)
VPATRGKESGRLVPRRSVSSAISKSTGAILKEEHHRIPGARFRRCAVSILVYASCIGLPSVIHADSSDATTNAPPALSHPLSTNSAAATFLENHPEEAAPVPADQPNLSLRPEAASTNAPPEGVAPADSGVFPGPLYEIRSINPSDELAAHLLVVYNTNDPDSKGLAQYYATRRDIPAERIFAISSPVTEEITRQQYDDTIRSPIVCYLGEKGWMSRASQRVRVNNHFMDLLVATHNDIWAIVLMRGVPLKIAPDPSDQDSMEDEPTLQTNAAAVDSELALLPVFGLPVGGLVPNMFFDRLQTGLKHIGPELARNMVLVTRLDGPKPSDVRRMIDDSLHAEKNRLAGLAVIDSRGLTDMKSDYTKADIWLRTARDLLVKDGWTVKFDDKPDVLPATDPLNHVALYLGWYHDGAIGPWVTPPNRFVAGAIAYHLHSYSAMTLRSDTLGWAGPLIAHGAAATMGTVYEPYVETTPEEDIFTKRLLQGSWMVTVVGDPLYRPFLRPLDSALAQMDKPHTAHDDWILLQKVRRGLISGQIKATTEGLTQALDVPGAGPVAEEGLGDLLANVNESDAVPAAETAYQMALVGDTAPVDRIRVGLKLAKYYASHGHTVREESEFEYLWSHYPDDAVRFNVPAPMVPNLAAPANAVDR